MKTAVEFSSQEALDQAAANVMAQVKPLKISNAQISLHTLTSQEVKRAQIFAAIGSSGYGEVYDLKPGPYAKLVVNGEVMMSTTQMERRTNREFVDKAHGHVLVAGLGLGLILEAIKQKPEVRSCVILEKEASVISLIKINDERFTVEHADIFHWLPAKGRKFDVIYFDIWPHGCGDNWEEVKTLKRTFRKYLNKENPEHWISAWREDDFRRLAR